MFKSMPDPAVISPSSQFKTRRKERCDDTQKTRNDHPRASSKRWYFHSVFSSADTKLEATCDQGADHRPAECARGIPERYCATKNRQGLSGKGRRQVGRVPRKGHRLD